MSRLWLQRSAAVAIWIGAVIGWVIWQRQTGLGVIGTAQRFVDTARDSWWALPAFVGLYLARPLVLFPATLLTVAAGILFGPWLGVAATVIGANLSAAIAWGIGRAIRGDGFSSPVNQGSEAGGSAVAKLTAEWARRLHEHSFVTVLTMRFLFLPYDLVNYASGALRVRFVPFLLATIIGSVPGTIAFVLAGASLERLDQGFSGFEPRYLALAAVLFVGSVVLARVIRSRQASAQQPTPTEVSRDVIAATRQGSSE